MVMTRVSLAASSPSHTFRNTLACWTQMEKRTRKGSMKSRVTWSQSYWPALSLELWEVRLYLVRLLTFHLPRHSNDPCSQTWSHTHPHRLHYRVHGWCHSRNGGSRAEARAWPHLRRAHHLRLGRGWHLNRSACLRLGMFSKGSAREDHWSLPDHGKHNIPLGL